MALFSADLEKLLDFYASHNLQVVIVTHAHRFGKEVTPDERPILVAWRQAYPTLSVDAIEAVLDRAPLPLRCHCARAHSLQDTSVR